MCWVFGAFPRCGEQWLLYVAVLGLLVAVASLEEFRLWGTRASVVVAHGLNSCSTAMWSLAGPGIEPMSPALAGGFLSTVPLGKSINSYFKCKWCSVHFSSVAQLCPTLRPHGPQPSLPVHHQIPESTETHVHQVGDAIQPTHSLSSPSLALDLSKHQGLFQ